MRAHQPRGDDGLLSQLSPAFEWALYPLPGTLTRTGGKAFPRENLEDGQEPIRRLRAGRRVPHRAASAPGALRAQCAPITSSAFTSKKGISLLQTRISLYFPHGAFHHCKATKGIKICKKHALPKSLWLRSLALCPEGSKAGLQLGARRLTWVAVARTGTVSFLYQSGACCQQAAATGQDTAKSAFEASRPGHKQSPSFRGSPGERQSLDQESPLRRN